MIQQITKPFREFFKLEASSGIMLLIAAILALVISNGSYSDEYFSILKKYITLGTDSFGLKLSVLHWINDVLMAIFFFFVSLEIKREFLQGELSNPKQALLPIIGAVGGMVVPALFYIFINYSDSTTLNGWAIPSATDIAFSLGVLSLLGKRVPISLKVFLTALAIIDDLGAIVIIAFFYSGNIQSIYLILMLLSVIVLIGLNKFKVKSYVCELNVLNNFWTARVTSHIPLKDVAKNITIKNILEPIKLVNKYLKKNGLKNPKVGVQALNPHAEFGNEEKKIIIPAINKARKMKIKAFGPLPCDTSFIRAYKNKEYNCLVGMYHDAIQSGLKSFGFEKGVTVQGGLPIPITTPAHGTAFDIVGKNKANVSPMLESLKLLLKLLS